MLTAWILMTPLIWLIGIGFVKHKAFPTREKVVSQDTVFPAALLVVLPWWAIYFLITSHWSCS